MLKLEQPIGLVVWPRLGDLFVSPTSEELCVSFSRTDSGLCKNHLFGWSLLLLLCVCECIWVCMYEYGCVSVLGLTFSLCNELFSSFVFRNFSFIIQFSSFFFFLFCFLFCFCFVFFLYSWTDGHFETGKVTVLYYYSWTVSFIGLTSL